MIFKSIEICWIYYIGDVFQLLKDFLKTQNIWIYSKCFHNIRVVTTSQDWWTNVPKSLASMPTRGATVPVIHFMLNVFICLEIRYIHIPDIFIVMNVLNLIAPTFGKLIVEVTTIVIIIIFTIIIMIIIIIIMTILAPVMGWASSPAAKQGIAWWSQWPTWSRWWWWCWVSMVGMIMMVV